MKRLRKRFFPWGFLALLSVGGNSLPIFSQEDDLFNSFFGEEKKSEEQRPGSSLKKKPVGEKLLRKKPAPEKPAPEKPAPGKNSFSDPVALKKPQRGKGKRGAALQKKPVPSSLPISSQGSKHPKPTPRPKGKGPASPKDLQTLPAFSPDLLAIKEGKEPEQLPSEALEKKGEVSFAHRFQSGLSSEEKQKWVWRLNLLGTGAWAGQWVFLLCQSFFIDPTSWNSVTKSGFYGASFLAKYLLWGSAKWVEGETAFKTTQGWDKMALGLISDAVYLLLNREVLKVRPYYEAYTKAAQEAWESHDDIKPSFPVGIKEITAGMGVPPVSLTYMDPSSLTCKEEVPQQRGLELTPEERLKRREDYEKFKKSPSSLEDIKKAREEEEKFIQDQKEERRIAREAAKRQKEEEEERQRGETTNEIIRLKVLKERAQILQEEKTRERENQQPGKDESEKDD